MDWLLNPGGQKGGGFDFFGPDFFGGLCTTESNTTPKPDGIPANEDPDDSPVLNPHVAAQRSSFPFGPGGKVVGIGKTYTSVPDNSAPQAGTGLRFVATAEGSYVVIGFIAGSTAEQCSKISVGDKLLEVDGRPVGGVMVQELARMLLGDEGTSVKLTFRKDNQLSNFQSQEAGGGNVMSLCTAGGVLQGDFEDYDVEIRRMTFSGSDQLGLNPSTPNGRAGLGYLGGGVDSRRNSSSSGGGLLRTAYDSSKSPLPAPSPRRVQFGDNSVNAASLVITAQGVIGKDSSGNTVDPSKSLEAYIKRIRDMPQTHEKTGKGGQSRKISVKVRSMGPSKADISVHIELFDGTDAESLRSSLHCDMLEMARHSDVKLSIPKKT